MKFELIYTFENREQEFSTIDVPDTFFKTKEGFSEYITREFQDEKENDLVKISCCALTDDEYIFPKWYIDCKGKLFF